VRELAEEFQSLEAQQVTARQALKAAEGAHRDAQEADSRNLAAAIRRQGKEPTATLTKKAEDAVAQATRRLEAVAVALQACETELGAAVDEARADWLRDLEAELQERLQEFSGVVEALEIANLRLGTVRATQSWVSAFEAGGKALYRSPGAGVLSSWRLSNGSFASMSDVLTALREMARPKDGSRVLIGQYADTADVDPERSRSTWLQVGR
jgi:hypothetical protein